MGNHAATYMPYLGKGGTKGGVNVCHSTRRKEYFVIDRQWFTGIIWSVRIDNNRRPLMYGKGMADRDEQAVGNHIQGSFKDNCSKGTHKLIRHLAHEHPNPKTERQTQYFGPSGKYTTTMYIYIYIPEDGIDETIFAVETGY